MDIVAITDKGFVMPTGVMMYSACVNNPETDITFHVIVDESVTQQEKDCLKGTVTKMGGKCTLLFYSVDSQISSSLPYHGRMDITKATYYRLFITEILPQTMKKVLYLDGDIIVRHSLQPLWDTDIQNYAIAAVTDYEEGKISKYNRLKYPSSYGYFNAGVLLINLEFWRQNHVIEDFTQLMSSRPEDIVAHDQDVLNYIFKDRKLTLPVKYNLQGGFLYQKPCYEYMKYKKEVDEALKDPVIIHYTLRKPWDTPADNHPFSSTFYKYQSQTIWNGQRTPDRRSRLIRLRRMIANVLRIFGILPPIKPLFDYIEIPPID